MLIKLCKYWKKRTWSKDEDGATAIEFAMLAGPFFFLILGLLETTLYFAAGSILEGTANHAARVIRTGQAQQSGDPMQTFVDRMCEYNSALLHCDDIDFEVIPTEDFADAEAMEPVYDADGNLISQGFDAGDVEDVVLIRMAVRYSFKTPMLGKIMGDATGTDTAVLLSTIVLRSEPYEFEG